MPRDRFDDDLRRFGPAGIVAILVILLSGMIFVGRVAIPLGAILALIWTRWSRTPWRDIGYVRPASWIGSIAFGGALGVAFKVLMKAIVMPLFDAPAVNPTYHYLAGNRTLLPAAAWMMIAAGFGEETVFRGFLFERLRKLFGSSVGATIVIVLITSALFGLAHYSGQGLAGVEQAAIVGLALGAIFAATGRIWVPMFAHAAFDLTALAMIYCDVESKIAHLVFR